MENDRKKRRGLRSEVTVPVNLERLLLKAAGDKEFEAALLTSPMEALERFGVRATGSEKMMLNTMRPQVLGVMIERLRRKPKPKVVGFAGAVAAAALAGGMFVASCDSGNDMALDGGSSPDIDTDTDGDTDTDADADTDSDTDTDTDTGVNPDAGADGGDGGS